MGETPDVGLASCSRSVTASRGTLSVQPDGPAVVYFYPAAMTPGCTMEAKGFSDRYDRFREAGTR